MKKRALIRNKRHITDTNTQDTIAQLSCLNQDISDKKGLQQDIETQEALELINRAFVAASIQGLKTSTNVDYCTETIGCDIPM